MGKLTAKGLSQYLKDRKNRDRYGIIMFNKSAEMETTSKLRDWKALKKGSKEQTAIWKAMETSQDNLVVNAYAGTGKTTTCLEGLMRITKGQGPECSTSHSMLLSVLKEHWPKVEIHRFKVHDIVNKLMGIRRGNPVTEEKMQLRDSVVGLVSAYKNTLLPPTKENFYIICDRFGLDLGKNEEEVAGISADAWSRSLEQQELVDFDDMLFYPAFHGLEPAKKFKFLVVDEAQDYNVAQRVGSLLLAERLMFIGDRYQSIYSFRGADANSIPNIITELQTLGKMKEFPLTVSRRCCHKVVESVLDLVPEFKAMKDAPQGLVEWKTQAQGREMYKSGDMVLCRTNAPLCSEAFALLASNRKCKISGRDFGKSLVNFVKKMKAEDVPDLVECLEDYRQKELDRLKAKAKYRPVDNLVDAINDKVNCIEVFCKGNSTIDQVLWSITDMFDDDIKDRKKIVLLSSIHKAKGDESKRVFIVNRDQMPSNKAKNEEQRQQEKNIIYVGHTRAMLELYLLESTYQTKD